MKIYRVHLYCQQEGSQGNKFFGSKADAKREAAQFRRDWKDSGPDPEIDELEVAPTKKGIIEALNSIAGHPDNG